MDRDDILERAASLDQLGVDLGKPEPGEVELLYRADAVGHLARCLEGTRVHPVLVGDSGVGKSALVASLGRAMAEAPRGVLPGGLRRRRVIHVTASDLISGALYANQLEHKVKQIAANCKRERAFLFLDDLPAFVGAGSTTNDPDGDLAGLLHPFARRGDLRLIAATTPDGWMQVARRSPQFARLFTPIGMPEMARDELARILHMRAPQWSSHYRVMLTNEALDEAIELAERLFPWKKSPGRVCDLVEAALAVTASGSAGDELECDMMVVGEHRLRPPPVPRRIGRADMAAAVRALTGLPEFLLVPSQPASRHELTKFLRARVFGQQHVLGALVDRIQMIKTRLCAPDRPLAAYLLAGPTGVGKTLVARTLAALLLGDEDRLIRFDMSEFCTLDSVARFVGENTIARRTFGLVDAALAEPFPIILLDEVEKAHRGVFDVLLQVLGEGRLTDESGRTAYFTNAVILMTSNLGASSRAVVHPRPADDHALYEQRVAEAVRRHFRPEFVNRLTEVFAFQPLERADIEAVARRELERLAARSGLTARNVRVRVSRRIMQELLRGGYSPEYGVRPMERAVDALVGAPLARHLAEHPDDAPVHLFVDFNIRTAAPMVKRMDGNEEAPHVA